MLYEGHNTSADDIEDLRPGLDVELFVQLIQRPCSAVKRVQKNLNRFDTAQNTASCVP